MKLYPCNEFDITKVKGEGRTVGIDLTRIELYRSFSETNDRGVVKCGIEARFHSGLIVRLNVDFEEFHKAMIEAGKGEKEDSNAQ